MIVVLIAALLHASWNFLVKKTVDKHMSMSAVVFGHAPFAVLALLVSPSPTIDSLPYMVIGALLHTGYQLFLLNSYRFGDLSQVYPLARGVAPLIVTLVSLVFLGVPLTRMECGSILIIGAGIMSLVLLRHNDGMLNRRAAYLSIATGGFIAAYSLIDGLGARKAGTAVGFYGGLSFINAIIFAAFMRFTRPGSAKKVVTGYWRLALFGGGASFTAYALVIWAFTQAPIAMVTALRETSIIFALLLGVFVLKERFDIMKLLATVLTIIGVVMLRIN